ncbi:MAG: nitroreductase family protein [Desulfovibrio sp.]|nr:MAG: nitroreductase family protein [Desulfovibrio sp.]
MDIFEAIHTRRSIRSYTDGAVSQEQIDVLLQAAMTAPSAGNAQPWHFIVVQDRAMLDRLSTYNPYVKMLAQTPLAILVLGDLSLEKYPGYWPIDCSAAVQNLLLAARGMELGAVWTGVYPDQARMDALRDMLAIPKDIMPHSLIPVGVPAVESKRVDRFKPERIHQERW